MNHADMNTVAAAAQRAIGRARRRYLRQVMRLARRRFTGILRDAASAYASGRSHSEALARAVITITSASAPLRDLYIDTFELVAPPFAQAVYDALAPARGAAEARQDEPELIDRWLVRVQRFIEEETGRLITGIRRTLLTQVRAVVIEAQTEGLSVGQIATRLTEAVPGIARSRATLWARTETLRSSNAGSHWGALEAETTGLVIEKVWLTAGDGRVRETHAAAHEQRRGLAEAFDVGGYSAQYPHASSLPVSEVANCRCTAIYEPKD